MLYFPVHDDNRARREMKVSSWKVGNRTLSCCTLHLTLFHNSESQRTIRTIYVVRLWSEHKRSTFLAHTQTETMGHSFEIFLCDARNVKKVREDSTPIEQDVSYHHCTNLKEGWMEGLLSNDLVTRGLEQQYVCLSSKNRSDPDRDVEHGDFKGHFLWVDKSLGYAILNMHDLNPTVLELVPTELDKTSNIFAKMTHYVGTNNVCMKAECDDDLYFWWLKPGTNLTCSNDVAQLGDIAVVSDQFVAHMRPMDTGCASFAQCIRPYNFSCIPHLEETRQLHLVKIYNYALCLTRIGLSSDLRQLVMQKSGLLEYARFVPPTEEDLQYWKEEWDEVFERYEKDWLEARWYGVRQKDMRRKKLCEYGWDIPKFATYCVYGDKYDKEQEDYLEGRKNGTIKKDPNFRWEQKRAVYYSVSQLLEYEVLDPKLDCLVCFRPLVEHERKCIPCVLNTDQ
jgi:hypothetical protein